MRGEQVKHILNGYASDFLSGDLTRYTPFTLEVSGGVTVYNNNDNPFQYSPITGMWKSVSIEHINLDKNANMRLIIPYNKAHGMAEDKSQFFYVMGTVMNLVIAEFHKTLGSLRDHEITTLSEHFSNQHFNDIESMAGYLINFYARKK